MEMHIVDQFIGSAVNTTKSDNDAIKKAAKAIVDLLCEADMTVAMAGTVLDLCKESLQFTPLYSRTKF